MRYRISSIVAKSTSNKVDWRWGCVTNPKDAQGKQQYTPSARDQIVMAGAGSGKCNGFTYRCAGTGDRPPLSHPLSLQQQMNAQNPSKKKDRQAITLRLQR